MDNMYKVQSKKRWKAWPAHLGEQYPLTHDLQRILIAFRRDRTGGLIAFGN